MVAELRRRVVVRDELILRLQTESDRQSGQSYVEEPTPTEGELLLSNESEGESEWETESESEEESTQSPFEEFVEILRSDALARLGRPQPDRQARYDALYARIQPILHPVIPTRPNEAQIIQDQPEGNVQDLDR